MEKFLHSLLNFDKDLYIDLINKLKNNEKLNEYEFHYLRILKNVWSGKNV